MSSKKLIDILDEMNFKEDRLRQHITEKLDKLASLIFDVDKNSSELIFVNHLLGWSCLGLCWWVFAFTVGFFQTIMWSLIITSCLGIYFSLKWRL